MEILTKSAEETKGFGKQIANKLKANSLKLKGAKILALTGDLGSGKTTFVQGLAEGLGIKQRIISPTFIIIRKYLIFNIKYKIRNFYHVDLYRLEENIEREIVNLGMTEIWSVPNNIVAIEWGEKIDKMLPNGTIWIRFENLDKGKRKISVD